MSVVHGYPIPTRHTPSLLLYYRYRRQSNANSIGSIARPIKSATKAIDQFIRKKKKWEEATEEDEKKTHENEIAKRNETNRTKKDQKLVMCTCDIMQNMGNKLREILRW